MVLTQGNMRRIRQGFTIIELMLVVAILSMMAAMATPSFVAMMYRSKRIELVTIMDGIYTAQLEYNHTHDTYVSAPTFYPREALSKEKVAWPAGSEMEETLGYRPDGQVAGKYKTDMTSIIAFEVIGEIDVDGDGQNAVYQITYTEEDGGIKEQDWMTPTDVY